VPGMTEPPRCYDVTITVDRDGSSSPNPAEFAVAAGATSIVSAHAASQIVSDRPLHDQISDLFGVNESHNGRSGTLAQGSAS
jgi:hypothetical protein